MNSRQRRKERRRLERAGLFVPLRLFPRGKVITVWDFGTVPPVTLTVEAYEASYRAVLADFFNIASPSRSMAEAHQRIFLDKLQ